jgi:flagellar protein FlaF
MHQAANVYARVAKVGQTPREIEASVLLNAAARLQAICDKWDEKQDDLVEALTYNRRVWTVLSSAATAAENPLPDSVKASMASLAMFIFNRTFDVMVEPAAPKLKALVAINREIAAGLRAVPTAVQTGQAA